jgi:hypothetical protein
MKSERSGLELLEEAISLVRSAPARAWTWYLSGAIPFFAALLFYLKTASGWLAVPEPGAWSLVLSVLFLWRQLSRSVFGRVLAEEVSGERRKLRGRVWLRAAIRTWFSGVVRMWSIVIPAPHMTALFRNYQAYAWVEDRPFRRAALMTSRGGNALTSWLTLGLLGIVLWINVLTGFAALPVLFRILTGEESTFTNPVAAVFNRTALLASFAIAWCLVDVVLEAMYVLRRFYGESEETGADLLLTWRRAVARTAAAAALVVCLAAGLRAQNVGAREALLNRSIDRVLTERQYQWREPLPAAESGSAPFRWMESLFESISRAGRAMSDAIGRVMESLLRWLAGQNLAPRPPGAGLPVSMLRVSLLVVALGLGGLLVVLLIRSWTGKKQLTVSAPSPKPVSLADPAVLATDLPEDQWLALAREWTEKGDPRLALRAWFLAALSLLDSRGLLSVSSWKSNLDYRREIARRARRFPDLEREFGVSVRRFEAAWYGLEPVNMTDLAEFSAGVERIRGLSG